MLFNTDEAQFLIKPNKQEYLFMFCKNIIKFPPCYLIKVVYFMTFFVTQKSFITACVFEESWTVGVAVPVHAEILQSP